MAKGKMKSPAVHDCAVVPGHLTNLAPDLHNLQRCQGGPGVTRLALVQREVYTRKLGNRVTQPLVMGVNIH